MSCNRRHAAFLAIAANEAKLRASFLSLEATKSRHLGGSPRPELYDPDAWTDEFAFLSRPGEADIQTELFYDYRNNVASYPAWQAYLRQRQPPTLVLWGKYDPSFALAGAAAYAADAPAVTAAPHAPRAPLDLRVPKLRQVMTHSELLADMGSNSGDEESIEVVAAPAPVPMSFDSQAPLGIVDSLRWSIDHPTQVWAQIVDLAALGAATDAPPHPGVRFGDQLLGNLAVARHDKRQPRQPPVVSGHRHPEHRQIIRLGAAAGKHDFAIGASQSRGHRAARAFQTPLGRLPKVMDTGRIAVYFGHGACQILQHLLRNRRGSVVIEVKVLHFLLVY